MKEEILKIINKELAQAQIDYDSYPDGTTFVRLNTLEDIYRKVSQMQLPVKPEIAEEIKTQLKEKQLMYDVEVVQCMGDPDGISLPTHILIKNSKESKWYIQTDW